MRSRITWIAIVVGLLGTSVVTYGVMIVVSVMDPSFAIEPDYEARAANWDAVQRQMSVNTRLGWRVSIRTEPGAAPGTVVASLTLTDRDGAAISNAAVRVEAFHNARAADILEFAPAHAGNGIYPATLPIRRPGVWEFRVVVDAGIERFTATVRKSVAVAPRSGGRG